MVRQNEPTKLRYLTLPDSLPQEEFDAFVARHQASGMSNAAISDLVGDQLGYAETLDAFASYTSQYLTTDEAALLEKYLAPASGAANAPQPTTLDFLSVLFRDLPGVIELRMFSDVDKDAPPVHRDWFPTPEEFVKELPRLLALSLKKSAGIFYGVLPRSSKGVGKAEHVLPGRVLWADLDTKDYPGGIDDLRARVNAFPLKPSIIVWSGHGVHLFWLLDAVTEPAKIAHCNERIAAKLGGDHAWDRARVLRLPGTVNRKRPDALEDVELRTFEPDLRYSASDVEAALEAAPAKPPPAPREIAKAPKAASANESDRSTPKVTLAPDVLSRGISTAVSELIRSDKKVGAFFMGTGKPEKGPDGKATDRSGSGLDFSFAMSIARKGIVDPSEIAAALASRPDGHARRKGLAYLQTTVGKVLALITGSDAAAPGIDFEVTRVVIFKSDPPTYVLAITGVELRLESRELMNSSAFSQRFLATFHRIPALPRKKQEWVELVNGWLAKGELVDLPAEASVEGALREALELAIENLPLGDEAVDLDSGKAISIDEHTLGFKAKSVLALVQEDMPEVKRHQVNRALNDLGLTYVPHRIGEKSLRLWTARNTRAGDVS
ncbi:MAG: hypothetical protein IPJ77_07285 [Planctomycetes bacterium]|nr:hypothetical protein [Planctomycetota bacterium]